MSGVVGYCFNSLRDTQYKNLLDKINLSSNVMFSLL